MQTVSPLPTGQGALKITTALFFRPGGKSTQKDGVAADVEVPTTLSSEDTGEAAQDYALAAERIAPFIGSFASALGPKDRWSRVSAATLAELARRSRIRIAESDDFAKMRERVEEYRASNGIVHVSDLLKEDEAKADATAPDPLAEDANGGKPVDEEPAEAGTETAAKASETDDAELSPQVEEALDVLGDLVALTRRGGRNTFWGF